MGETFSSHIVRNCQEENFPRLDTTTEEKFFFCDTTPPDRIREPQLNSKSVECPVDNAESTHHDDREKIISGTDRELPDEWKFYTKEFERIELPKVFDKKFTFELSTAADLNLPLESEIYAAEKWEIEKFMEIKAELNNVKNKLNDYELDEWHFHTRLMNRSGNISYKVKNKVQPDLYTLDWCKFYEICSAFNLIPKKAQENFALNSLHLCEEPGCFITSLNHFLKLNYPRLKWDWLATTLNPYYEGNPASDMMNDDRLIFHTLNHWIFGEDYTGDIINLVNLKFLIEKSKKMQPILLITADGSLNCQNDPDEQELTVGKLIFYEIATALSILSEGGNFVIKIFTMFEEETICIMYLLACAFKSLNVFKPTASKEGNSEAFVVCLEYKNCEKIKSCIWKILTLYESNRAKRAMFPLSSLPQHFLDLLKNCVQKFKNEQIQVIERNIKTFGLFGKNEVIKRTKPLKEAVATEFITRYGLRKLEISNKKRKNPDKRGDQILGSKIETTKALFLDSYIEIIGVKGSLNERLTSDREQELPKLQKILEAINKDEINWTDRGLIWSFAFPEFRDTFKMVVGKPVGSVMSSRFCSGKLLKARSHVLRMAKDFFDMDFEDFFAVAHASKNLSPKMEEIMSGQYPELIRNGDTAILNFNGNLWNSLSSGNYDKNEKNAFRDIAETVNEMESNQNLIIEGYPLLTQFSTGIIYLLGHSFEKIGFVRAMDGDFGIILFGFRKEQYRLRNYSKLINEKMGMLKGCKDKAILSLVPITDLIGKNEELFSCITAANNFSIQGQIRRMILMLSPDEK